MDGFSIWHWLIVLIFLSPVILGFALMGPQRGVMLKHRDSGLLRKGRIGYSWTYLLFGWMVPVFRGEIGIGVLHLILTVISLGLFQLVMPYLYNRQYMTRQLTSGWVLADSEEVNQIARLRLGIAA